MGRAIVRAGDVRAGDGPAIDTPAGDGPAIDTPAGDGPAIDTPAGDRPAIDWAGLPGALRALGLRWTPQRQVLVDVLRGANGHVTGADLVERCRALDPATTPSTVYRTLDVLEQLGVVRHGHRADGREEFHVLPAPEHGHLYCRGCGTTWELDATEVDPFVRSIEASRGVTVDLSHVTVVGECRPCREAALESATGGRDAPPWAGPVSPRASAPRGR